MCTSIYQYFFIIDSYNFNDQGNKFIQFFEKAREETIKYYKFKFYDLIQRLIGKKSKKENKSVTITINEIFFKRYRPLHNRTWSLFPAYITFKYHFLTLK